MAIKRQRTPENVLENYRRWLGLEAVRDGQRAEATRALLGVPYLRGDLHMHSRYSDGQDEVADMAEVGAMRGLDFMFVTDHGTVRQKVECAKHPHVWWGQEPGAGPQHIGILANRRKYEPVKEPKRDAERLRALGCFFWFPHPVGWYHRTWYPPEYIAALKAVEGPFAIEVINGIFRTEPFFDEWTAANVALWDELLCEGRRVIGLGATDSHWAAGVGNTWTGVVGVRNTMNAVIAGLRTGNVFASMGPAIHLACGDTPMGGAATARGGRATVQVTCADSRGLQGLTVVQNGRVVKRLRLDGETRVEETVALRVPRSGGYVRAECASVDDLRAYANPIYFDAAR